jgi:hypothetical protein
MEFHIHFTAAANVEKSSDEFCFHIRHAGLTSSAPCANMRRFSAQAQSTPTHSHVEIPEGSGFQGG